MQEKKRKVILSHKQELVDNNNDFIERAERDGIELEKGAVITNEYLERNRTDLERWVNFFTAYPDIYLDIIRPADSEFSLFFYQRMTLRALMRFKDIFITAPRAFSKSFITILAFFLQCVFIPGRKLFICANTKQQAAQITKEKLYEIFDHWPLLKKEVIGYELKDYPGNYGKDYVQLRFRNGSVLDVVLAGDATRGGRRHGGMIDEIRKNVLNMYHLFTGNGRKDIIERYKNTSDEDIQKIGRQKFKEWNLQDYYDKYTLKEKYHNLLRHYKIAD